MRKCWSKRWFYAKSPVLFLKSTSSQLLLFFSVARLGNSWLFYLQACECSSVYNQAPAEVFSWSGALSRQNTVWWMVYSWACSSPSPYRHCWIQGPHSCVSETTPIHINVYPMYLRVARYTWGWNLVLLPVSRQALLIVIGERQPRLRSKAAVVKRANIGCGAGNSWSTALQKLREKVAWKAAK